MAVRDMQRAARSSDNRRVAANKAAASSQRRVWIAGFIEHAKARGVVVKRVDLGHCVVKMRGETAGTVMTWEEAQKFVESR